MNLSSGAEGDSWRLSPSAPFLPIAFGQGEFRDAAGNGTRGGQALVAPHQAGGLPITNPAYQRGVSYLLKGQAADGSWPVKTRMLPLQKYFESGFPYGEIQWISAAASTRSTMALVLTVQAPVNSP
jgi:hypothetical protein